MVAPDAAFALRELRWLRDDELPFLAAHWLAEGYDGPRLRELAGVTRGELGQVTEQLWRGALKDAGVTPEDVPVRRTAAPFLARAVLAGDLTERRLCAILWPERLPDGSSQEPDIETLVYQWDDLLDYQDRLAARRWPRPLDRAELDELDAGNRAAVEALAEGDIDGAVAALTR